MKINVKWELLLIFVVLLLVLFHGTRIYALCALRLQVFSLSLNIAHCVILVLAIYFIIKTKKRLRSAGTSLRFHDVLRFTTMILTHKCTAVSDIWNQHDTFRYPFLFAFISSRNSPRLYKEALIHLVPGWPLSRLCSLEEYRLFLSQETPMGSPLKRLINKLQWLTSLDSVRRDAKGCLETRGIPPKYWAKS